MSDDKGRTVRTGLFENCLLLVAQHMVQFDIEDAKRRKYPSVNFLAGHDIFNAADDRQIFIRAVLKANGKPCAMFWGWLISRQIRVCKTDGSLGSRRTIQNRQKRYPPTPFPT